MVHVKTRKKTCWVTKLASMHFRGLDSMSRNQNKPTHVSVRRLQTVVEYCRLPTKALSRQVVIIIETFKLFKRIPEDRVFWMCLKLKQRNPFVMSIYIFCFVLCSVLMSPINRLFVRHWIHKVFWNKESNFIPFHFLTLTLPLAICHFNLRLRQILASEIIVAIRLLLIPVVVFSLAWIAIGARAAK